MYTCTSVYAPADHTFPKFEKKKKNVPQPLLGRRLGGVGDLGRRLGGGG